MGNIVLLDDLTINQIAAGEVIERPASVVKEMVENSIDAGATKITVEIKNGGISFIRISDNGKGIAEDDMEIAFERHATSKIRKAEDILKVMSMGFRGEALASIAAIANVEMISRTADSDIGHKIVVEGGKVLEQTDVGAPIGTTITVKNLFYNTPVRYKFLKKDYTESGYIEDAITRLALVNKNISFKLINSGKTIIQTNGNDDEKSVIYSIYGKDIAEAIIETDYELDGIRVRGCVGKPEIARSNRTNQLYFVNGRYIKHKTLTAAAEQAFKGMIPINKYGFLILNIEMDPGLVDVNVHPAKLEVRFEEDSRIFKAVYYAIKESLSKKELVESVKTEKETLVDEFAKKQEAMLEKQIKAPDLSLQENMAFKSDVVRDAIKDDKEQKKENKFFKKNKHTDSEENFSDRENLLEEVYKFRKGLKELGVAETSSVYTPIIPIGEPGDDGDMVNAEQKSVQEESNVFSETQVEQKSVGEESAVPSEAQVEQKTEELIKERETKEILDEAIKNSKLENPLKEKEVTNSFDDMYSKVFGCKPVQTADTVENKQPESVVTLDDAEQMDEFKNMTGKNYKFLGIAFSTYIIVEIENEMYIIDQHAAHERIMYEKVKKNYFSSTDKDSQLMLLPDIINLTHKEKEIIKENVEMFEKAGFTIEEFGDSTIKLTGVPNICMDMNTKQLFLELLDEIDNYSRTDRQDKEDRFIATIACKSAVKAKMKLTESEVDKLMEKLLELPNPFTCPHGRPTAIKMSKYEIERKFARK